MGGQGAPPNGSGLALRPLQLLLQPPQRLALLLRTPLQLLHLLLVAFAAQKMGVRWGNKPQPPPDLTAPNTHISPVM